jgi:flagellin FlaB
VIKRLNRLWTDERGITALETAIILIAFVVVAAVFAFTVLSAGTFLTERSEEAAYAGLEEVRGSLERKGDVVAYSNDQMTDTVGAITFKVAIVAGGEPVDLTSPTAAGDHNGAVVHMSYRDDNQEVDLNENHLWHVEWPVQQGTADEILEHNELALVTVLLTETITSTLGYDTDSTFTSDDQIDYSDFEASLKTNETFNVEVIPPSGAVLNIERTTPPKISDVEVLQ